MDGDIKIIYKNRLKENYLKQNKNLENINFVKEFFNQYLTYESKKGIESIFNANNFIKIYNFLYLIKDKQNLLDIYSYINQLLVKFINTKLITDEKNNQDIDHIIEIIKYTIYQIMIHLFFYSIKELIIIEWNIFFIFL